MHDILIMHAGSPTALEVKKGINKPDIEETTRKSVALLLLPYKVIQSCPEQSRVLLMVSKETLSDV